MAPKKVVVVGGGFSGLSVVQKLGNADVEITLLDRKNHHCFQPLLYQVATASLSPADIAWPIRSVVSNQKNVRTVMAEVTGIDVGLQTVLTKNGCLSYDILVLAAGATHSYFAHPEWSEFAPGLKSIDDATAIRSSILRQFEIAEAAGTIGEQNEHLTFVVIGGGPTGVELAGSIVEISSRILSKDFRAIDPSSAKVILIEAGPRLLPNFPSSLSDYAARELRRMGVNVLVKDPVIDCNENGITLGSGRTIPSHCVLWAAGVRASDANKWLGQAGDRAGRVLVDKYLRVNGYDNIYAIGDTASVIDTPIPGIAPAAKQMGRYVGGAIQTNLRGRSVKPFQYRHHGDLATIGRKSAVVSIGRFKLRGFIGWLFWSLVHVLFLINARSRFNVAINWLWEYLTLKRGARLINRP